LDRLTKIILKNRIPDYTSVEKQNVRTGYGLLAGWSSIVINVVITAIKGIFGILTGSVALIADAFHSLSDVSTSLVLIVSFKIAQKPSDASHPFGHGRMEAIATLIISVLLMVAGIELFKSSILRITTPKPFHASWLAIVLIVITIIMKEWLARFTKSLARMTSSSAIEADFWHHRTDAISSLLVIAAFIGQRLGFMLLDGIMGILVAGMIIYTAWHIARTGIDDLLGRPPSPELVKKIKAAASAFPQVLDVHDLIVHYYGRRMILSLAIEVEESLSLKAAHALAEQVEASLDRKFHAYTTVHCDPVDPENPEIIKMQRWLKLWIKKCRNHISFHNLKLTEKSRQRAVSIDLSVDPQMNGDEINLFKDQLRKAMMNRFPELTSVVTHIEPRYVV